MITKDLIAENTSLEEFFSIINDLLKSSKVQEMKKYKKNSNLQKFILKTKIF